MAQMNHRTTFALDDDTIRRLKKLAALWHVSQAEAVRRALEQAEEEADREAKARIDRLTGYHAAGGLVAEKAQAYLDEVAENRSSWGRGQ